MLDRFKKTMLHLVVLMINAALVTSGALYIKSKTFQQENKEADANPADASIATIDDAEASQPQAQYVNSAENNYSNSTSQDTVPATPVSNYANSTKQTVAPASMKQSAPNPVKVAAPVAAPAPVPVPVPTPVKTTKRS